jgi:general secretion pathway protein M
MQWLPDRKDNRPLAIGLLIIALILIYMVGFHGFVVRHAELADEAQRLTQQAARFKAAVAREPDLRARLQELEQTRAGRGLFLPESGFNSAAASLTRQLQEIIQEESVQPELCTVQATQNVPDREPERFERVTVNVRMECPLDDISRVLYALEDSRPLVFVDNLMLRQRITADRAGRRGGSGYGRVDISFNMYGFLTEAASSPSSS